MTYEDRISKQPDNTRLKRRGNPVSQHKIQMIAYFANLVGLGFNLVGTFLLLKYPPESKTTDGWTVTGNFEKELIPAFEGDSQFAYSSRLWRVMSSAISQRTFSYH